MVKMKYVVSVCTDLIDPGDEDGEIIDTQIDYEYYDTYAEAETAAKAYPVGSVTGFYGDGVRCVVHSVEISDDPEPIDFFD